MDAKMEVRPVLPRDLSGQGVVQVRARPASLAKRRPERYTQVIPRIFACAPVAPQRMISARIGRSARPRSVRLYSTLRGTTGYALRPMSPRCSSSLSSRLRMRGVIACPSHP